MLLAYMAPYLFAECRLIPALTVPGRSWVGGVRLNSTVNKQYRYIEWRGVKIYDFQKVTFSTLYKLYIAGLGVLIPKRYHMLG